MQVQKLVYIAHGFYLAAFNRALIDEQVEAWPWGPVIRSLYRKLKTYGSGPVSELISDCPKIPETDDSLQLIDDVWKTYGSYTGAQLSTITHRPGSPWDVTWRMDPSKIIDDMLTADYYKALLSR